MDYKSYLVFKKGPLKDQWINIDTVSDEGKTFVTRFINKEDQEEFENKHVSINKKHL